MKRKPSVSRRALAFLIALGVALTLVPQQVWAAEGTPPSAQTGPLTVSITKAARTLASSGNAARVARDEQQKPGDELAGSSAFFTKPLGLAVLGILAIGTGYAVYSLSHDRIHSEARQNQ